MITKSEILSQLESFSAAKGKPVIVHSSLKAIGKTEDGAEGLLSVLIDFFTAEDGLLCVPTHTWDDRILNLKNPSSCIGVLPTVAAAHPLGKRSLHPSHSMSVFGREEKVCKFIKNEPFVNTPTSPDGCYGNLYKEDGYVLLIGVDQRKNTFIHCVEEMLGVDRRFTKDKIDALIIYPNAEEEKRYLYWFDESHTGDVSKNFGKFEAPFRYFNCICDGMIGNAKAQLCSTRKIKDVIEKIYKNAGDRELLADDLPIDEALYNNSR